MAPEQTARPRGEAADGALFFPPPNQKNQEKNSALQMLPWVPVSLYHNQNQSILDTVCVCNNTVYTNMYLYINKLASPSKYICSTHACTYSSMSTDQDQTNRTTETQ